ncbi:Orotidine 5'-phosphate decarboxylase [subsurface metagenome]
MNSDILFSNIKRKRSFLCIGLDSAIEKIPPQVKESKHPIYEFNKQIISNTASFAVAYKPNLAFYECRGLAGWKELELTVEYIRTNYPDIFLIADAKRGDIGNTSSMYAKAFFENLRFDAITVAPYMGEDSIKPFLSYNDKYVVILALTSNPGAADFQYFTSGENKSLFTEVIEKSKNWGTKENIMYVVGATKASMLASVRKLIPNHFLLVPGIGAQGGDLEEVAKYGLNKQCGLLVNSSRSILYAGNGIDFAEKAANEAKKLQKQMEKILLEAGLL